MIVSPKIPKPFEPLLRHSIRYKFYYGGRGGGKSYAFADSLLIAGYEKKLFIACLREIQDSITDSVHKLLCDRISHYGYSDYEITDKRIRNRLTGTEFIFKGLRDQDSEKIKSLEGVDIVWLEEAHKISRKSWEILDPTIRKDGSEIWISMNREEETDPLWTILAANPDHRTLVVKVNYYDNPFCPEELKIQAAKEKEKDYENYLHIWEGYPKSQGDEKLISSSSVKRAFECKVENANNTAPLVIGVDVARYGDDKTVIARRRGRQIFGIKEYKHKDTVEVANIVTSIILSEHPVRVHIDSGYNGAGVIDILKDREYKNVVREVNFGAQAQDAEIYGNRRAEMWGRTNDWLNAEMPVQMENLEDVLKDLTAPKKKYDKLGRLLIEEKAEVKKRLGNSPDYGDAIVLTFAEKFYPQALTVQAMQHNLTVDDNVYV